MSPRAPDETQRPGGRVVAITGACTYLGTELVRRLEEDRRYARVLLLDVREPPVLAEGATKARYFPIDLTQPTIDAEIATLLEREQVDTVVHGAFLATPPTPRSGPTSSRTWARCTSSTPAPPPAPLASS